jgi:subtilisin family serine protease
MRVDRVSVWRRKLPVAVLAAVVALGAGSVQAGNARADVAREPTTAAGTQPAGRTVTLITGDRVTIVDGTNGVAVTPGPGREKVGFVSRWAGSHLQVVPTDALALLRADRLDRRLFDVTALIDLGYDDRHGELPLIVSYTGTAGTAAARAGMTATGARPVRNLPSINADAIRQGRRDAARVWAGLTGSGTGRGTSSAGAAALRPGVAKVWLDGRLRISLDVSVPLIGAPAAWQAGYTGAGVAVAVLDSGIDDTHPDLTGKVTARQNFTTEDALDRVGHGTHVASTITGSGAASGGRFKGVAPDASLFDGKVCDRSGLCEESAVIAGMQWAAADRHAKVVNISLGRLDTEGIDPMEQAIGNLTAQYGTLFVVAAGNNGGDRSINTPASADAALAVGAVTKAEDLADFSSRGPRVTDTAIKPDLTAPGVDITAARSKDGFLGNPGERYVTLSGTSMATPHVTGTAAILAQRHPDWSPATLKAALMASAKPNPAIGVFGQGAGRVDIARAIDQTVVCDPVSITFGTQLWPHTDDVPVTKTVTYHNYGAAAVTLQLAMRTTDPAGNPTPAGMFSVSPASVTVPAGGDASVAVTADTRVPGPAGFLGGTLTATAGATTVQTPLGLENEDEVFPLTITHLDRDGRPTSDYSLSMFDLDKSGFFEFGGPSTLELRLPKGRYAVSTAMVSNTEGNLWIAQLVRPELMLDRPQRLTFDARAAKPVTVRVPSTRAKQVFLDAGYVIGDRRFGYGVQIGTAGTHTVYTGQLGGARKSDRLVSEISSQWAEPGPDGTTMDSPAVYVLAWFFEGKVVTGFTKRVATRDLATVRADYAGHVPGSVAEKLVFSTLPGKYERPFSWNLPLRPPLRRTELYNNDPGTRRTHIFIDDTADESFTFLSTPAPVAYRAGQTYHESWNRAVFGPAFPRRTEPFQWVWRTGDTLTENLRLFCDAGGHAGDGGTVSGATFLYRDGVLIGTAPAGSQDSFAVPPDDAGYRLEVRANRLGAPILSTTLTAAWTFRSRHLDGTRALPLSGIAFRPAVSSTNTAPKGRTVSVPVVVKRQDGTGTTTIRTLTVEVSYDEGATWQPAPLESTSDGGVARLTHPDRTGFVSLRANLTDTDGNTAFVLLLRAYRIG